MNGLNTSCGLGVRLRAAAASVLGSGLAVLWPAKLCRVERDSARTDITGTVAGGAGGGEEEMEDKLG